MNDVHLRGPLFDRRLDSKLRSGLALAERAVADRGVLAVRRELGRVLKHPTGHYASRIRVDSAGGDPRVSDGGVVYGPWLAGTSRRNQTTRFKGYKHWRRAHDELQGKTAEIADPIIEQALRGM